MNELVIRSTNMHNGQKLKWITFFCLLQRNSLAINLMCLFCTIFRFYCFFPLAHPLFAVFKLGFSIFPAWKCAHQNAMTYAAKQWLNLSYSLSFSHTVGFVFVQFIWYTGGTLLVYDYQTFPNSFQQNNFPFKLNINLIYSFYFGVCLLCVWFGFQLVR